MKVVAAVVLLASAMLMRVDAQVTTADYCAVCADHTMCKYSDIGCTLYYNRNVTPSDITTILDEHNRLRNKVASGQELLGAPGPQPSASNMRKIEWDQQLAGIAQRWADQCSYGHDACRKTSAFSVGQNAAEQRSSANIIAANFTYAVNAWYDEVSMYSNANINISLFTLDTGHYTQVVWANTYKVGCGYIDYKKNLTDTSFRRFYVCNYGPAGNFFGKPLYLTGTPASACPIGTVKDTEYPALCANASTLAATTTTTTEPTTTTTESTTTTTEPTTTTSKPTTTTSKPTTTTNKPTTTTKKPTTTTKKPTTRKQSTRKPPTTMRATTTRKPMTTTRTVNG